MTTSQAEKAANAASLETQASEPQQPSPLRKITCVASLAGGIQFGWALQLSLLTPYVQLLGIPHKWASLIWLCGPVSGLLVQPIVGYHSDRCTSRFGRRRPFIAAGSALVTIAVFLIGYSVDIGHRFGDSLTKTPKTRAIAIYALGFWFLDVANNTLQGPCRAFLADLAAGSARKTRIANALFSFFMAVGNVLGYAAGSYTNLYKVFPFTLTKACDVYCANLKSCFFLSIAVLLLVTVIALYYVEDKQWSPQVGSGEGESRAPFFGEMVGALKELKRPMWMLMIVTALNWVAWFPFILFDTDWMGREVYGGDSSGSEELKRLYNSGVRAGSLGLMLNAIVLGFTSLGIEWVGRKMGGAKRLWGVVNFILAIGLAMTVVVTKQAESHRHSLGSGSIPTKPPSSVKAGALTIFAVLGIPQAITFSIPFALASIFSTSAGAGQGLSLGVLNLAIVIPQMVVSVGSGPFDELFGGGNLPAFVGGAIVAAISGIMAFTVLPSPPPDTTVAKTAALAAFH